VPTLSGDFLDSYLPYLLRQADQALSADFYEALNQRGVQRSEWRVIAVLHERGSLSMRDLTVTALSPQPTVTHAVARLEKRGLVQRLQGTDDRRQRFVSLTPQGEELAAALIAEARALEIAMLQRSGAGDLTELLDGLRLLHTRLDPQRDGAHV
jgi:DNA-binding MarR family transcriptional regulator